MDTGADRYAMYIGKIGPLSFWITGSQLLPHEKPEGAVHPFELMLHVKPQNPMVNWETLKLVGLSREKIITHVRSHLKRVLDEFLPGISPRDAHCCFGPTISPLSEHESVHIPLFIRKRKDGEECD